MIEDKLEHDERLRLESVAQAIQFQITKRTPETVEALLTDARRIADYIENGAS